jgi:hypothetical protein
MRHEPFKVEHQMALAAEVAKKTADKKVTWTDPDGNQKVLNGDASTLSALQVPELAALYLATHGGEKGGENDLRVHVKGKGSTPISVLQDLEGNIQIISPPRNLPALNSERMTKNALAKHFGLRHELRGIWEFPERQALFDALALLSADELQIVQDLHFVRAHHPPDRNMSRAALFEGQGCKAKVNVYASGVAADKFRFVGEPAAPKNAMLHSIIHEIGHALEHTPARLRHCAAQRARGNAKKNAFIRQGNELLKRSPVLAAYQAILGDTPAPTEYGRTSPTESFAEAFALFRVDPAALKRVAPKVHAWFERGGHMKAQIPLS